jgi:TDG/mug DNA glycosylase family protein
MPILPDVLAPGLDVVFCGSAAGAASAAAKA